MNRLDQKRELTARRKTRIRDRVKGNSERPRLTVTVSNASVSAQIIDDTTGKTLASASDKTGKTMTEKAANTGKQIAAAAKKSKVSAVVFDKNGKQYQQRLKALADAAREEGLEF